MSKLLTEAVGTFFLVLVIALTGDPLTIGVVLMVMVYMGGYISGAHYNPAATLGIWMQGAISTKHALQYIGAQIGGALLAVIVAGYLGSSFIPSPAVDVDIVRVLTAEFLFTCALVLVILHVAINKKTQGNMYYGAAIGLIVYVGAMSVGSVSGGVFNPAVGLGPWLWTVVQGGGFAHIWIYIVGPLLGGVAASLLYKAMVRS